MQGLIYQDSARYDWWIKLVLGVAVAAPLVAGLSLLSSVPEAALPMFGIALFDGLLFGLLMPRRYQVFQDGIRLVLGGPFHIDLPFRSLQAVQPVSRRSSVFRMGVSFTTSFRGIVEIVLRGRMTYYIVPVNSRQFIELANQAMRDAASLREGLKNV
jgi:hypothetical protein